MALIGKSWILAPSEIAAPGAAATAIEAALAAYIATPVSIVNTTIGFLHGVQLPDGRLVLVLVYANA